VYDRTEKIYITSRGGPVGRVTPKPECTTSKAPQRGLTIYPRELHEIQQAASTAQNTKS
jgi:antitoxin (DNA-binding transcriptional repressor) of toxin-antitoxin stability system